MDCRFGWTFRHTESDEDDRSFYTEEEEEQEITIDVQSSDAQDELDSGEESNESEEEQAEQHVQQGSHNKDDPTGIEIGTVHGMVDKLKVRQRGDVIYLPLQYYFGLVVAYRKKALSVISIKRTTLMEKILWSIKLIKIYGWEASFFQNIHKIRLEEKKTIANINIYQSIIYGVNLFLASDGILCCVWNKRPGMVGSVEKCQGVVPGNPKSIPADDFHLMLHQIFLCPMPEQPISCHSVEVTILGKGGRWVTFTVNIDINMK